MSDLHIFDLDNTLVNTDELNNKSYNFALAQVNLNPISALIPSGGRITRSVIFNAYHGLNDEQRNELVCIKQRYFINNIKDIVPNTKLFSLLYSIDSSYCILWTSAEKNRAEAILNYYKIENAFIHREYSDKTDLQKDLDNICKVCYDKPDTLIIYENDVRMVKKLQMLCIGNLCINIVK